ncbi:hypothetical protein [Selenomonas ruminantium]|uniref:hypothetical protein n=1 Tax=Selenomonas ruminantium TaxID=971 RepID=UPI00156A5BC2|nr:hypothetical protein [Selenomonas ruminantium]
MDEMNKNKMDDMEMDKVSGGRCNPGGSKKRPRPGFHDSNANSMAANVMGDTENANSMAANVDIDKTQNASGWLGP